MLTDFHSHILPGIDDGSRSVEESVVLLETLKKQGAGVVVATPHFDANKESVEHFLERRRRSYESLKAEMPQGMPDVLLGAEIVYYPGISRLEELEKLCIEGMKAILLEMPMNKWSRYTIDELMNMTATRNVRVIVAHVERCQKYQDNKIFKDLLDSDVLFQINTSFIVDRFTRRKSLNMLKKGRVQLIGSDCHNMKSRPPRLDEAYEILTKRVGSDFVRDLTSFGRSLITK